MRRFYFSLAALSIALLAAIGLAQQGPAAGPYKVLKTVKVGGPGGYDYVDADEAGRRLYIARSGNGARITVFNLDTLEPAGEIPDISAHGAVVSARSHHGFATSKPVTMFDAKTLAPIKTMEVPNNPDGAFYDAFNDAVYILSHIAPQAVVIHAADGSVAGAVDLGGAAEEAVSDGKGHMYIDVEDKGNVAVVDAKTMTVTAHYDLEGKGGTCAGLALDAKNHILFAACRNPQAMVILNAENGKIITALPIGQGTDGAAFNPKTMEAFSSNTDGTLTVVKETSPTSFVVEQTLQTMVGAKTMVLDGKTNRIFLIAAEFASPAAPQAPGGRPARGPMVPDSFSILMVGR